MARSPLCPYLRAHTAVHAVPAPGPRVAGGPLEHRRCGGQRLRASRHAGHRKTNILFLRCAFRPAHPQDGTCETTSLSAWRAENSLLNKSRGTVPKHTKVWQEAKANALPRCTGDAPTRRRLPRRPGLREVGPRPARAWRRCFSFSCLELGAPRATSGHRQTGPRCAGALTAPPPQPHVSATDAGFQRRGSFL